MTSLTVVCLGIMLFGILNRRGYAPALALAGATPVGAAYVAGAVAVPTFYTVATGACLGVGLMVLHRTRSGSGAAEPPVPAGRTLVLLATVSVLVTLVAPYLFDGLPTLSPTGGPLELAAGVLTKSNLAQIVYLLIGVSVVIFLARSRWAGPEVVGTAALAATVLSFWSWTHTSAGVPFPDHVFDNSPAFTVQDTLPGGLPRVRGIFSEPSSLAASCLITLAYGGSRVRAVGGLRRVGLCVVMGMALYLGSISTSTTFFVAGIALVAIAALAALFTVVVRKGPVSRLTLTVVCMTAVAALWALPWLANALGQALSDKVASSSYAQRSGADSYSYDLVWNTVGFGTGLGSNRASSFVASLLSTIGIVGAVLFIVVVWVLVRDAYPVRQARPVVWALVALLLAKVIAGPDLSDSSGILWTGLGVLAHTARRAGEVARAGRRHLVGASVSVRSRSAPARRSEVGRLAPSPPDLRDGG